MSQDAAFVDFCKAARISKISRYCGVFKNASRSARSGKSSPNLPPIPKKALWKSVADFAVLANSLAILSASSALLLFIGFTLFLAFPRPRHLQKLHAIVLPDLEVHRALTKFLTDPDHRPFRLAQMGVVADDGDPAAFIAIKARVFRVKPLSFGYAFIRTAAELGGQRVNDSVYLLQRNFPAIVEPHRNERRELHQLSQAPR